MAAPVNGGNVWGEFETKFTPLISFHSIVDEDMGIVKTIIMNYRNDSIFDLKKDNTYIQILSDVYKRKYRNPIKYLLKENTPEMNQFIDECYHEFITEREEEILENSVTTDMYNLLRDFINSSEVIPAILYYTEAQKKVIAEDPLLCKVKSISLKELQDNPSDRTYEQFYFKYIEEGKPFFDLKNRTFYFSTTGQNLDDTNEDIKFTNEEVYEIYKLGSKINLFDMYRTDIIGGYSNNGSAE